jgi:hypothetical protein
MSEQQGATKEESNTSAEVALLREENERLREAYRRTKQVQYRRSAAGLALLGTLALMGAVLFPDVREILLVLGAIGLFGGVLTVYLTPERVLTASVTEAVYQTHAETGEALVDELGLQDDHLYVPAGNDLDLVRVYRPKHAQYEIPDDVSSCFLVEADDRAQGVAIPPIGDALYREFSQTAAVQEEPEISALVGAVADGVVEQFELAETVDYELEDGRLSVEISGEEPSGVDRFDHPIMSLFAVALAKRIDTVVECASINPADSRFTLTWTTDAEGD